MTEAIPNAAFDDVAAEFDPYIAKLTDRAFSGWALRQHYKWERGNIRGTAVCAVDSFHGFTCEFSPCPEQHCSEYDTLEELLTAALSKGELA